MPVTRSMAVRFPSLLVSLVPIYPRTLLTAPFSLSADTIVLKGACIVLSTPRSNKARKEEGYALMKKGIMANLKSSFSWHVQALVYRAEGQLTEAIKSYNMCLKFEPSNAQGIMRDVSTLQVQTGAYEGFAETRRQLLVGEPSHLANWAGYAVASHLAGRISVATQTVSAFLTSAPKTAELARMLPHDKRFSNSELHLYRNELLAEQGGAAAAWDDLMAIEGLVVDTLAWNTLKGKYALALNKSSDAEAAYLWLLAKNPENWDYYRGLIAAMGAAFTPAEAAAGLPAEKLSKLTALFKELSNTFPKSAAAKRLPLDFLPSGSPEFAAALAAYVQPRLRNAMPSLFRDLSSLYVSDSAKRDAVRALMEGYAAELAAHGRFEPSAPEQSESPIVVVWVYSFLANHADLVGEPAVALKWLDKALAHSPTLLDLHLFRASVLKHAGDAAAAYAAADTARAMDLADRYANTKTTQYALQAGHDEAAENIISLFLKDGATLQSLHDLQVNWYATQRGFSFRAKGGEYRALALRSFKEVEQSFTYFSECQTEFHNFALRKATLRSYVSQLRFLASVRGHKFYVRAQGAAAELYMDLHDERAAETAEAAAARIAAAAPARAAITSEIEARPQSVVRAKQAAEESSKAARESDTPYEPLEREDPFGWALYDAAAPLEQAARLVNVLTTEPTVVPAAAWVLAARVHARRGKLLLALRALNRARRALADLRAAQTAGDATAAKALLGAYTPAASGLAGAHAAARAGAVPFFLDAEIEVAAAEIVLAAASAGPEDQPSAVTVEVLEGAAKAGELAGASALTAAAAAAIGKAAAARAADKGPLAARVYAAAAAVRVAARTEGKAAAVAAAAPVVAAVAPAIAAAVAGPEAAAARGSVHALVAALTAVGATEQVEAVKKTAKQAYPLDTIFFTAEELDAHLKANTVVPPKYE